MHISDAGGPSPSAWLNILFWAVLAVTFATVAWMIFRHRDRKKKLRRKFQDLAAEKNLSEEQRNLLAYMGKLAALKNPLDLFSAAGTFDHCLRRLTRSRRFADMPKPARKKVMAVAGSLRLALGFTEASAPQILGSRQVPEGANVSITDDLGSRQCRATMAEANDESFTVRLSEPFECSKGGGLFVIYAHADAVWQIETEVVGRTPDTITLKQSDRVRLINRRRHQRVKIHQSAYVAGFPFTQTDGGDRPPRFLPAKLMEIGAAGAVIQAPLQLKPNGRALLIMNLRDGKAVQALGRVRRSSLVGRDVWSIAFELVDLNSSEIAEMASEMNARARESAGASENLPGAPEPAVV